MFLGRFFRVLALCLMLCLSVSVAEGPVTVWHATDLHHLSPELTDYGEIFDRLMAAGDGKLTEYSGALIDELIAAALAEKPDVLVITGDLTFNGEKQSLIEVTGKLKTLTEAGVPVLLLPGNHDIGYPYARSYFGAVSAPAENVSPAEFSALCAAFGPDQALSRDETSFSYIYAVGDSLWLILLDANSDPARSGNLNEETLVWLEEWLTRAREEAVTVLSFTHQNLLPVNPMFADDFVFAQCRQVAELYLRYGVYFNFSGHAHLQHLNTSGDGLFEVVTGALCVSPLHYGKITVDGGVEYEEATLPAHAEAAARRFRDIVMASMYQFLDSLGVSGEAREAMAEFAADLNQAYFAGDLGAVEALRDAPAWKLWKISAPGTFWFNYLWSILEA